MSVRIRADMDGLLELDKSALAKASRVTQNDREGHVVPVMLEYHRGTRPRCRSRAPLHELQ